MALTSLLVKSAFKSTGLFFLNQWKWIVLSIIALILLFFAFKVYGAFKDRDALLEEREGRITQLVKDNTEAEIEKQSLQATVNKMLEDRKRIEELHAATIELYEGIYEEVASQKKIFEEHDFTKLSNAKPGLIIRPMNKATKERFDEISSVFND
jgi:hypothetical protein